MKKYVWISLLVVVALGVAAASFYRTPRPIATMQEQTPAVPQSTSTPMFGGVSLMLEYATTSASRAKGLGDRAQLAPDDAMLFVFPNDDYYGFWMKDTLIPLDMFWLDDKGQVVSIAENVATSSYPHVFYPSVPARYVLETVAGFAKAHGVATGTPLVLKNFPTVTQ